MGSSRFSKRLPEAIDRLLPWDTLYSKEVSLRTGIGQDKVKSALKSLVSSNFAEISTWTEEEFPEASDILDENDSLRSIWQTYIMASKADILGNYLLQGLLGLVLVVLLCATIGFFNGLSSGSSSSQ